MCVNSRESRSLFHDFEISFYILNHSDLGGRLIRHISVFHTFIVASHKLHIIFLICDSDQAFFPPFFVNSTDFITTTSGPKSVTGLIFRGAISV